MKTLNPANANWEKTWIEQHQERELVHYLKETIDNICDRVRNKLVAPYAALTIGDGENPPPTQLNRGRHKRNPMALPCIFSRDHC